MLQYARSLQAQIVRASLLAHGLSPTLSRCSIRACLHVELQSDAVVADGQVYLSNTIVAAATIKEGVGVFQVELDDLAEVLDRLQVLPKSLERDSAVMQRVDVILINGQHLRIVINGVMILA